MSLSLAEITEAAEVLRSDSSDDRLLKAAELADQLDSALWDPTNLIEVSTAVAARAAELGCTIIAGASPVGDRIAAAAVALADTGVSGLTEEAVGQRICVVDGFVSTGWNIRNAVAEIEMQGSKSVVAVALLRGSGLGLEGVDAHFLLEK